MCIRDSSATLRQASQDITDFGVAVPSAAITAFDQPLGTGDGVINTFQLKKLYTSGGQTWTRTILKPVVGTVQAGILTLQGPEPVSYTHLDVYKRQVSTFPPNRNGSTSAMACA